eukprot:gene17748-24108_t
MDARASTGLSSRGYSILKSSLTPGAIAALKKELTMTPLSTMGPAPGAGGSAGGGPAPFPVFMESSNKIYVPKYFGLKRFGAPARRTIPEGAPIDIAFTGSLRKEQMQPVNAYLEAAHDPMRMGGILSLPRTNVSARP